VRVAALYDIHGNLPALEAVLAEADDADLIVVGGDVAWGPMPEATIDRLMELRGRARFVMGNADREVLTGLDESGRKDVAEVTAWVHDRLTDRHHDFLESFESTLTLRIEALGETLFCHGSPRSDTEGITETTPDDDITEMVAGLDAEVVVCGHTHRPFDRVVGNVRIVNPGSVGLPYGENGAFWALFAPDVTLKRADYDFGMAARLFEQSGVPHASEFIADIIPP
jgi:putative phosphoesterase